MTENTNEQRKMNTFAQITGRKRTPLTNAEQEFLPEILGPVFRVIAAGNDPVLVRDDNGNETGEVIARGTYSIMPIAGRLANKLASPLTIKTKGRECIFNHQQCQQLMWTTTFISFEEIKLWTVDGQEGLSAEDVRVVKLSDEELKRIMSGQFK